MRRNALAAAAAAVALAACLPGMWHDAQARPSAMPVARRHPVSGLPVVSLSVTHAGKRHLFKVEVARSEPEQEKGLMFRTAMGAEEGMIFPMNPPRAASFWMKNTVLPLDIIYIGADHRILNISANAVPYSETPLFSEGRAAAVLELNGGRAAKLGIGKGDVVKW